MTFGADQEVVQICSDLIRIPSVNPTGDERAAAEHVAALLAEVGLEPELVESEPRRTSVVARMSGTDPDRAPLLVHGHLDVVPADPTEWRVHPFSGEVDGEYVWGRGAVDMKDMDAMVLAVVRERLRSRRLPARPIVLAFVADEEAGGSKGARWLVENRPELFEGCTEAISEVGGFSLTVRDDLRLYLIETAQKGIGWIGLTARGRGGHGSMLAPDNPVLELAEAVARLGRHQFPVRLTPTVRALLAEVAAAYEVDVDLEALESGGDGIDALLARLGSVSKIIGATLRHTLNPSGLQAGSKVNMIPTRAYAEVDGRYLPGGEADFEATVDALLGPNVSREWIWHDQALETSFDGPLVDAMRVALQGEDPCARPVPYMLSGGTDAKSFSRLGIRCFGFSPLRLPPELDFAAMFHGVDERVPVSGLQFGVRVLDRFLDLC